MKKKKKDKFVDPFDYFPVMTCAVCTDCREILDPAGNRTGRCMYGGPFKGYVQLP